MHALEIINIDDNTRIVVYPDHDYVWDGDGLTDEEIADLPDPVGIVLEKITKWQKIGTFETRDIWEEEESIWGCYCDSDYTPEDVAREYFGVSFPEPKPVEPKTAGISVGDTIKTWQGEGTVTRVGTIAGFYMLGGREVRWDAESVLSVSKP